MPAPVVAPGSFPNPIDPSLSDHAGLTALGPVPQERKARDWALVLQSSSIWHAIRRVDAGWIVLVRDGDYGRAATAVYGYEVENRDWPPRRPRERARHASSAFVPIVFAALVGFFFVTGPVHDSSRWFDRGAAVSALVMSTEPWRAVTALTLHADSVHILGNAISGTVFSAAVQRRLGPGGGMLAVLASGILGNLGNAFWHHTISHDDHASIGASTAVFGAVGLLAATQFVLDRPERTVKRSWLELAAPIVGGLALLGALGASPEADLGAHLFGFLSGVLLGVGVGLPLRHSSIHLTHDSRYAAHTVELGKGVPFAWVQAMLGLVAAGIVVGAWVMAMR